MGEHLSGVLQVDKGDGQPDIIFAQSFKAMTVPPWGADLIKEFLWS